MAKITKANAKQLRAKAKPRGPNKTTKLTRELITNLIENEYFHMIKALTKLRTKNPSRYMDVMQAFMEYALPKLSRTELSGPNGKPMEMNLNALSLEDLKKLTELNEKMQSKSGD